MQGGSTTRAPIMTAYRQQALACAGALVSGPKRPRDLKAQIAEAPKILLRNVYGWFLSTERGIYELTDAGRAALKRWPEYAPAPNAPKTRAQSRGRKERMLDEKTAP
jgi:hypothetical protein